MADKLVLWKVLPDLVTKKIMSNWGPNWEVRSAWQDWKLTTFYDLWIWKDTISIHKYVYLEDLSGSLNRYWIHPRVSPILNSESTNCLDEYLLWFLFQLNSKLVKELFWTNKKLFSLSTTYLKWENLVETVSELNWWNYLMNSFTRL